DRALAVPPALPHAARRPACVRPSFTTTRALGGGGVRGPTVRRAHRGAAPRRGAPKRHARPRARRSLHRRAADDAVPPARTTEPAARRLPRPRSRTPPLARLVPRRRRRDGDT